MPVAYTGIKLEFSVSEFLLNLPDQNAPLFGGNVTR
jgi:hypothetical protein